MLTGDGRSYESLEILVRTGAGCFRSQDKNIE
jgi:hypothetical protein